MAADGNGCRAPDKATCRLEHYVAPLYLPGDTTVLECLAEGLFQRRGSDDSGPSCLQRRTQGSVVHEADAVFGSNRFDCSEQPSLGARDDAEKYQRRRNCNQFSHSKSILTPSASSTTVTASRTLSARNSPVNLRPMASQVSLHPKQAPRSSSTSSSGVSL